MSKDPNDQHNPDHSPNTATPAGDKKATNPKSLAPKDPIVNKGKQQGGYNFPLHGEAAPQPNTTPREFPFIDPDEQESDEIIANDDDFVEDTSTDLPKGDHPLGDSGPEEVEDEEEPGYKRPQIHRIIDMDF